MFKAKQTWTLEMVSYGLLNATLLERVFLGAQGPPREAQGGPKEAHGALGSRHMGPRCAVGVREAHFMPVMCYLSAL